MRVVPDPISISRDLIAHSGRSGSANVKDTVNVLSSAMPLMSSSMLSPSTRANASPSSTARFPPVGASASAEISTPEPLDTYLSRSVSGVHVRTAVVVAVAAVAAVTTIPAARHLVRSRPEAVTSAA